MDIVIKVPPEEVFRAWTDPEEFVAWWGDENQYQTTGLERDLQPGGRWESSGRMRDGSPFTVGGEYLVVDPPHRLSFTWQPSWEQSGPTTVELEFQPIPEGTLLVLRHHGFTSDQSQEGHNQGWIQVVNWLKAHVESKEARS